MSSLKEIKGRITSVQSTLKITSAMKLVASAKLRKAQRRIEAMRPYADALQGILARVDGAPASETPASVPTGGRTLIVAIASNASLCGAFNANVIRKVSALLAEEPSAAVWSIGRKMADAMKKKGYASEEDFTSLAERADYDAVAALSERLKALFDSGAYSRILLVYNHFESSARQLPRTETFLPAETLRMETDPLQTQREDGQLIIEPSASELLAALRPKVLALRLYTALLDSSAAEHAARTVAMQIASDNAEDLLHSLTLQYNKSRQQKITSEILDLSSGGGSYQ